MNSIRWSLCLCLVFVTAAAAQTGIVLLAHGGRVATWNEEVKRIAAETDKTYPTEVAFGMATKTTIQRAVDKLAERGVKRIIAVPLFVSSHSSVITSTEWLLGVRPDMPQDYRMFAGMSHGEGGGHHHSTEAADLSPVKTKIPIHVTPALNHHPIVASILADRAAAISRAPQEEVIILVAHGPNPDDDNVKWLADLRVLAEAIQARAPYHRVDYLTVRDDAPEPIASQAKAAFRSLVEKACAEGKQALVVPVLLSFGGVENRMRERLKGLEFTMAPQGLLPDSRIVNWVLASVRAL